MSNFSVFKPKFVLVLAVLFAGVSCKNISEFEGKWVGDVSQSRLVRHGIDLCTQVELNLETVGESHFSGKMTLKKSEDVQYCSADITGDGTVLGLPVENVDLVPSECFFNDSFSNLSYEGNPLFTHMAFANLDGKKVLVFISYFDKNHSQLRIISPEIYGVFDLYRP
ncbi:MAG: hypothetical protein PF689_06810 [Deltaproteobacteria bacterium]|jgi:hypothetical protein|nr:hypothetical protein [Deltaproteobacteria bacterium]